MPAEALNAAQIAYRKAIRKTRNELKQDTNQPAWLKEFAARLPEKEEVEEEVISTKEERLLALKNSTDRYGKLAWWTYDNIVNQDWFEAFIMSNILLIGIATGIDLENRTGNPEINSFVEWTSTITMVSFTAEVIFKLVAQGHEPWRYFTDSDDGAFNCFDFFIVAAGFAFMGNENGSALGALRLLRLLRLLTFIKGVPQLRVIVSGLVSGMMSVSYIVMLLFLVIYLFAIMGCLFFGVNDPARFGTVPSSMLSLFQVSTLASWTSIAYTSWYGCKNFLGDPYGDGGEENPSIIHTMAGDFQGFKCDVNEPKPVVTFIFFSVYIVLTSWVIMSLFIGVISMGMFEAFEAMKAESKNSRYKQRLEDTANMDDSDDDDDEKKLIGETKDASAGDLEGGGKRRKSGTQRAEAVSFGFNRSDSLHDSDEGSIDLPTQVQLTKDQVDRLSAKAKLRYLINNALEPEDDATPSTLFELRMKLVTEKAQEIEKADWFNNLITFTILVVGIFIGIDTDALMACERHTIQERDGHSRNCDVTVLSIVLGILAQVIFTGELLIKVAAQLPKPMRYLDDPWNKLDAFIVFVGFVEMTPGKVIFEAFPVVILRLLRLLRVFRLAKALPRLRSIVEALISGFSAVGWVCVLVIVFNYIVGCMCMLILQKNDPFHFGTVGRAVFTILRIETADSWDQILYINLYGCDAYPGGYPMVAKDSPLTSCTDPVALGWIGVFVFFCIIILGAYVLPTVLIGIVVISFEEASRKAEQMQEMLTKMVTVIGEAQEEMPDFFTEGRIDKLRTVFEEMDADGELTLDINEMTPFFEYTFQKVFDLKLTKEQQEQLFHLMDLDGDTELGFAEFVMFVVVIKQIEEKAERDPMFAAAAFPKSFSTKKMAAAAASGGGAVKALPGSLDAKLSVRNKLGDKGRVGSTPEERRLDAGRSLPEVVALAIDSQRIADRVLRDKRGEANEVVGGLLDRLTLELVGAVLGGPDTVALTQAQAERQRKAQKSTRRRQSASGPSSHRTTRQSSPISEAPTPPNETSHELTVHRLPSQELALRPDGRNPSGQATPSRPPPPPATPGPPLGPEVNFELSAAQAAVAAEEAWQPRQQTSARVKKYSAAAAAHPSGRRVTHVGGLFTEASVAGIAPMPGVVAAKGQEWEEVNGAGAAALAWRKVVKMARTDPTGWIRSTEVMFLQLDKNQDGEVDILELAAGLKTLHVTLTQEQLLAFRDDMDVGKNGAVSLDEFLMAVKVRTKLQATIDASDPNVAKTEAAWTAVLKGAEKNPGAWAERVGEMFAKFDADGSGAIDIKELGSGLASLGLVLGSSQLRAFQEDIDFDGDGEITLAEFLMAVRQHERLKEQAKSAGKNTPASGIAMIDTFDDLELDAFNRASNEAFAKIIAIASSDPKGWKKSVAKLFATFDRDGSRQIDVSELAAGLKSFGVSMTSAQLVAFRDEIDTDGDFRISLAEFEEGVRLRQEGILESPVALRNRARLADAAWVQVVSSAAKDPIKWASSLPQVFDDLDLDKSGTIDTHELANALPRLNVILSPPELKAFARSLDANRDGVISYGEFEKAVHDRMPIRPNSEAKAVKAAAKEAKEVVKKSTGPRKIAHGALKPLAKSSDKKKAWAAILESAAANPTRFEESIDELFANADTNENDEVNTSEVTKGIRELGIQLSPNELTALRDDLNAIFDGKLSRDEFRNVLELRRPELGKDVSLWHSILALISDKSDEWQDSVEAMFTGFDEDGDGQITVLEFMRGLQAIGVEIQSSDQVVAFAREIDADGDGEVSLEEFSNAVEQRKPRRLEQDRRGDSLSGSNAWSTILAKIDENPQAWQRSVQVLFRTFDRDGSGQVDVSELAAGLKSMGLDLAPDMVMALRDELDADSNGAVSMREFEDAIQKRKPKGAAIDAAWEAILRAVSEDPKVWTRSVEMLFLSFDRDGSGEVNVSELGKGLTPLGVHLTKSQLVALIKELDTNGSGTISLAEFTKAVSSHQKAAAVAAAAAAEKEEEESAKMHLSSGGGAESAWDALLEAASGNEKTWTRKIEALFLAFDRDGNGNVDISELAAGFKSSFHLTLSPNEVKGLSADLDMNVDGTINLEEFMRALHAKRGGDGERARTGSNSDVSNGSGGNGGKDQARDDKTTASSGVKPLPGSRAAGGPGIVASRRGDGGSGGPKEKALDEAWGKILGVINEDPKVWARSIRMLFLSFDADGSGEIDINELASGLSSFGVRFNQQQLIAFRDDISGGRSNITLPLFLEAVKRRQASGRLSTARSASDDGQYIAYTKKGQMSDGSTGSSSNGYKKTSSKPQRTPSLDALLHEDESGHSSGTKSTATSGGGRTQALFTKPRADAKTYGAGAQRSDDRYRKPTNSTNTSNANYPPKGGVPPKTKSYTDRAQF